MFGKHNSIKKATCRSRYYTTSVVTRSVFGDDTTNPEVTKFMNMANMELPYVPIPGLSNPNASRASALFHARKLEKELKEQRKREQKIKRELDMEAAHKQEEEEEAKRQQAQNKRRNQQEQTANTNAGAGNTTKSVKSMKSTKQSSYHPSLLNPHHKELLLETEDDNLPRWKGVGSSVTRSRPEIKSTKGTASYCEAANHMMFNDINRSSI
jgi:flagellar biosynthesis GTPase FlhF